MECFLKVGDLGTLVNKGNDKCTCKYNTNTYSLLYGYVVVPTPVFRLIVCLFITAHVDNMVAMVTNGHTQPVTPAAVQ